MADGALARYRALAALLIVGNLLGSLLLRAFGGVRPAEGGVVVGGPRGLALLLVATSALAGAAITVIVVSCFSSFYRGSARNRFVGEDYVPAWTDVGMVVAVAATFALLLSSAR